MSQLEISRVCAADVTIREQGVSNEGVSIDINDARAAQQENNPTVCAKTGNGAI